MIAFLMAPILTFFSKHLYREALSKGFGRGFGYLAYLTGLFSLIVLLLSNLLLLPFAENLMSWFIHMTPEMTLRGDGLSTAVAQPYVVDYPDLGPIYVIDTNKTANDFLRSSEQAPIMIGKQEIVIQSDLAAEGARVISLEKLMNQLRESNSVFLISKQVMRNVVNGLKGFLVPSVVFFLGLSFFIWKITSAFLYSIAALVLNRMRKNKLRYRNLFALSCYAITPVTMIQAVNFSVPDFNFSVNILIAIALTICYLAYALFAASDSGGKAVVQK
jgi:hypothetical protein